MGYLNDEQQSHVAYLNSLPLDQLCWCGWNHVRYCWTTNECREGKTRAEYLEVACKHCMELPPHHVIGCLALKEDRDGA